LQLHLWQENLATRDIVNLVHNMILRESPTALDLDLGHSTTHDTLGEIAAMEYLFPIEHRIAYLEAVKQGKDPGDLAAKYNIPAFVVGRAFYTLNNLKPFFCEENGEKK
jgi:hypothetical protein